jgi:sugar/nucleoside kinase (ribokinase family)
VEEWGGIAYALAGLEAALPPGWEMVPLIKVGRDLSGRAAEFFRSLSRLAPGTRAIEVDAPNNRVVLTYETSERRCERMSGGVPGWTWPELGPMVRDLDALYVNFISGLEMSLGTATALRHGFGGMIYADLHSLFLGFQPDGVRVLQPLPEAPSWFGCFDVIQVNEEEMNELSPDPLAMAAAVLGAGARTLVVTLGRRGAAYVTSDPAGGPVRTALVPAPVVDAVDPTGCGDVFGATCCARLLAGDEIESAVRAASGAAARNATFRGATGLAAHLRGELVIL